MDSDCAMWCYLKVRITFIIAGINFKLLYLFWFSYLGALLSGLIFFHFIFCLPPSIHSCAHLRRHKFYLQRINGSGNCKVQEDSCPRCLFFFFNGACVLCGQFLHSNLVMRLKPFLTLLYHAEEFIWGGGRWMLSCHIKGSSIILAVSILV